MPSKSAKLLARLRQTKAGWTTSSLTALYNSYGFNIRSGNKHYIITHPDFPQIRDLLPHGSGEISPDYARDALKSIEIVIHGQQQNEDDDNVE